ncbi:hypothetical protein ACKI2N_004435 [Cupriavidus sp. 30B13]|uniref:hypothetical protein n=1 Tax=Cupriavidus sp. 30B13 TaxID=3384241 RepID=UPI003B8FB012
MNLHQSPFDLQGRAAFISGASSGIGPHIARMLAQTCPSFRGERPLPLAPAIPTAARAPALKTMARHGDEIYSGFGSPGNGLRVFIRR